MSRERILKEFLLKLVDELNADIGSTKIEFDQQRKKTGNMSLTGYRREQ